MATRKRPSKRRSQRESTSNGEKTAPEPNEKAPSSGGTAPAQGDGAVAPPPPFRSSFPVVGIGASAGGLEALDELFDYMPPDPGIAFVVVTHQHPEHPSLLPELLSRATRMPVAEAAEGTELEPNRVYVGTPGGHLSIVGGKLHRERTGTKEAPKLPIDHFFRSLAAELRERAIGIVLSGTGTDGTLGVKAIKGESGMIMAQDPRSAKYAGMPSSAIATDLVDYVLPPASMGEELFAYVKGPYLNPAPAARERPPLPVEPMRRIFFLLRKRTGHDFSTYKGNTLRRRIERRMNVHRIDDPSGYARYLEENPHEIDLLFKELLIGVTNFFRDPEAWSALEPHLESLIRTESDSGLRAWVPGCATGEEAFSLAIALRECMEKVGRRLEVQIFATDLDADAIETARAGQYPDGIASDVSPRRLTKYFTREDDVYRIRKDIREMVIFAPQNVIKDPPFTRLDVLSCRNLLIYLDADSQKWLVPLFHYALRADGLLFLGPSETIGSFGDLFEPLDRRWKIFRRKEGSSSLHELPASPPGERAGETGVFDERARFNEPLHLPALVGRLLLRRFVPPSVVVNARGDILYVHGRTGAYLEPAPGTPPGNVVDMAREGLSVELASALRECARTGEEVRREGVRVKSNGGLVTVDLSVEKLEEPAALRDLLLVTLRPASPPPPEAAKARGRRTSAREQARVAQLEQELRHVKESHQTVLEELETSNEELKSANEELQSTNEELQSTNEELETSREEMQSLNEELTTVNTELQSKVDELSQINDDMQNLLNSTDIATLFLDNDLNIKRYTEEVKELVTIRPSDVGRPLSELASNIEVELPPLCREVLRTLVFVQREIRTKSGGWYLMRVMPYRTSENSIEGLVLTFVNIGQVKQAELASRHSGGFFEAIVDTVRQPLLVLDKDLRVISANRSFYSTFRTTAKQTEGERIYELGVGQWDIVKLRNLLEDILPRNTSFEDYEVEAELPRLGRRVFVLNARRLEGADARGHLILLALEDMTAG